jgi:hypothetical protein
MAATHREALLAAPARWRPVDAARHPHLIKSILVTI